MKEIFQPELARNSKNDSNSGNKKNPQKNKEKLKKKGRILMKIVARRLLMLL
ncbi:hypothetical protein MYP_3523 [Sporocytophaga myxococcoides]|uniref:Uncharacterized protein n=1 Tax=Sporocytophaga myxococcoides TaxID=153721 RepID=A0A098LIL8_9BACT|nr:hypothetical protein MYP_3523 [Sporocytophaga myxococcoides]